MKIKDLIAEIERCKEEYDNFLEWEIYTEQCDEGDKNTKRGTGYGGHWWIVKCGEGWEYFECAGFWTKFPDKQIFTINVNY